MEIRRQMLGIIIGVFITFSFITPAYSLYIGLGKEVCEMKAYHLIEILHKVKKVNTLRMVTINLNNKRLLYINLLCLRKN
jgi:hypothetical protein